MINNGFSPEAAAKAAKAYLATISVDGKSKPGYNEDEEEKDTKLPLHQRVRLNLERENLRRWLLEEKELVKRAIKMEPGASTTQHLFLANLW